MAHDPLLLVLGMHRSGTSLLCGILQRLGVSLPGNTIAGDKHNPEGYFEWDAVVALQERLLIDLHRWWPAPEGVLPLPPCWMDHPATHETYIQLRALLIQARDNHPGPLAIKDPRTSRLLPMWLELCSELSIPVHLLLAVRDPSEVVSSLLVRDGPLVGMDSLRAQSLWWIHNLEVIDAVQRSSATVSVVDFDRWFVQPELQLAYLESQLPDLYVSASQRNNALALINPKHRRSRQYHQSITLFPSVRRLHRRLLRQPLPNRWPALKPPFDRSQVASCSLAVYDDQPETWSDWLVTHRSFPAPRFTGIVQLASKFLLNVCGSSWFELRPHLLLQHIPTLALDQCHVDFTSSSSHQLQLQLSSCDASASSELVNCVALNLELPPVNRASNWLEHLRGHQLIFDPEPARVLLLRALGLQAWWLDPESPCNGWLQQPDAVDSLQWSSRLGLSSPPEGHLLVLGSAGSGFERDLIREMRSPLNETCVGNEIPISYWPGWFELIIDDCASGLLRAGWLQSAAQRGARLVCAGSDHVPSEWHLLHSNLNCLAHPLDAPPSDLRSLHYGQPLMAYAEDRNLSEFSTLRQWQKSDSSYSKPVASVAVSLFNYADCIIECLESIRAQALQNLELIVVDDASTDNGSIMVQRWIDDCLCSGDHPFVRVLILRHHQNCGLAAARNTAFDQSQAPWCFVVDADNRLFPDAVGSCLALADSSDPHLAVVHPLLAVEAEQGRFDDQRTLVSSASWQRQRLIAGNVVDAMALVRCSAWEMVGGYTHIEGGWEDFDFWCKLVEAGFHGIQCPRILALYRSHAESMSHCTTNRSWHALSRTLQRRHPWLDLPLAQTEASR